MPLATVENLCPSRRANRTGVAQFFDVSLFAVDSWIRRGCPVVQRGQKGVPWIFDLLAMARWRFAPEAPAAREPAEYTPRERKDWYDSERLRLLTEREAGRLLLDSDVHAAMAALLKSCVQTLDTLPDVLERDAGIGPLAVERCIESIDRLRDDLYERLGEVAQAHR